MERLTKFLVLALVVAMGATAPAALRYGMGGDWDSGAGWYAGLKPTSTADWAYSYFSTVANPTTLAAGDSGVADYIRMDLGGAWEPAGKAGLVINGTVNLGDGAGFDGLYLGGDSGGLVLKGAEVVVGSTGVFNTTYLKVTDQGIAEASYDMWIAGALNVTGLYWEVLDPDTSEVIDSGTAYIDYMDGGLIADLNLVLTDLAATITLGSGEAAGLISDGIAQTNLAGKNVGIIADDGTIATIGIVPEPATLALLGLGALVLRRKK